jgi:toxin ParE1/3/4
MKVRLTRAARLDLEDIWTYSAGQWGDAQADAYIEKLVLRVIWLTRNRGLWHARPDIAEGVYSFAESSHVFYFCEDDDALGILRILHGRMEPQGRVD